MDQTTNIAPISQQQQAEVRRATYRCIKQAEALYQRDFEELQVDFDLSGKCAGMYQVRRSKRRIRFNPWIFAKYYEDSLGDTVTHEVAHILSTVSMACAGSSPMGPNGKR